MYHALKTSQAQLKNLHAADPFASDNPDIWSEHV